MTETKIPSMKASVHTLPRGEGRRDQRVSRVVQARRRLEGFVTDDKSFARSPPRGGGRAWINGREVGGVDSRYAHLSSVYD